MTIPVNYRVKWTANQRLDLADLVDDQAGNLKRIGSAIQGISSYSSANATGAKGQVFSGFTIAQHAADQAKITGEGLAVDADGNLLFKTTISDPFTTTLARAPTTHIVHIYYNETTSTDGARRFWSGGQEVSQTVPTHIESNFGLYVTSANPTASPVDSDGSGHPTIACWRIQFNAGTGALEILEDLRPRKQIVSDTNVPNGPLDGATFLMATNVASIASWTRGGDSTSDALVVVPTDASAASLIWMLDAAYAISGIGGGSAPVPAFRFWDRRGGDTGTMLEHGSIVIDGSLSLLTRDNGTILIGAGWNANNVTIGSVTKTTTLQGAVKVADMDRATGAGAMTVGGITADKVEIGRTGRTTEVKGNLVVDGSLSVTSGPVGIVCAGYINGITGQLFSAVGSGFIGGSSRLATGIYQVLITGMTGNAIILATVVSNPLSSYDPFFITVSPAAGYATFHISNAAIGSFWDSSFNFSVIQL